MNRKTVIYLVLIFFAFLFIAGCIPKGPPEITEAQMCRGVEGKKPIGVTNIFSLDEPEIHCAGVIKHAKEGTELKEKWYYGYLRLIGEKTHKLKKGTTYFDLKLKRGSENWLKGEYILYLYLDGKRVKTMKFRVE